MRSQSHGDTSDGLRSDRKTNDVCRKNQDEHAADHCRRGYEFTPCRWMVGSQANGFVFVRVLLLAKCYVARHEGANERFDQVQMVRRHM